MKVGIMGASGYVGGELLRLIINHPEANYLLPLQDNMMASFYTKFILILKDSLM